MTSRFTAPLVTLVALSVPLLAQRPAVTAADYARAEKFLAPNLAGLVVGGTVAATWLPDERFWYRNQTATGTEIVVVDPVRKTRTAFADCAAAAVDCSAAPDAGGRGGGRGGGGRGGRGGGPPSSDGKPLSVSLVFVVLHALPGAGRRPAVADSPPGRFRVVCVVRGSTAGLPSSLVSVPYVASFQESVAFPL